MTIRGTIVALERERDELKAELERKRVVLRDALSDAYTSGEASAALENSAIRIMQLGNQNAELVALLEEPMLHSTCVDHDDPGCWWCQAKEGSDHESKCRARAALKGVG